MFRWVNVITSWKMIRTPENRFHIVIWPVPDHSNKLINGAEVQINLTYCFCWSLVCLLDHDRVMFQIFANTTQVILGPRCTLSDYTRKSPNQILINVVYIYTISTTFPLLLMVALYKTIRWLRKAECVLSLIYIFLCFLLFSLWHHLQNGNNMFPAPQPNNVPVAAPPKPKSIQQLEAEKAAQISPFRATLTTAGAYTGGQ